MKTVLGQIKENILACLDYKGAWDYPVICHPFVFCYSPRKTTANSRQIIPVWLQYEQPGKTFQYMETPTLRNWATAELVSVFRNGLHLRWPLVRAQSKDGDAEIIIPFGPGQLRSFIPKEWLERKANET